MCCSYSRERERDHWWSFRLLCGQVDYYSSLCMTQSQSSLLPIGLRHYIIPVAFCGTAKAHKIQHTFISLNCMGSGVAELLASGASKS